MDEPPPVAAPPQPPHPALTEYYPSEHERRAFVTTLFDGAAGHYDRVCGLMSLGSGRWYRHRALLRAGLRPGMKLLDVATGTGLVARAAARIVGPGAVTGIDASAGMLRQGGGDRPGLLVQGRMEVLPFKSRSFDFLTLGYALRHAADLGLTFRECGRVLRPRGRLLVLEITHAPSRSTRGAMRFYFTRVLPLVMKLSTRNRHAHVLTRYYWDTIAACVPPTVIVGALGSSGFVGVRRHVLGGVLSEYLGERP
jgi:demethylmenaquinone methyltransferase/2-methoxy-6-polyprenyl-1,4-benzoquinol methylase